MHRLNNLLAVNAGGVEDDPALGGEKDLLWRTLLYRRLDQRRRSTVGKEAWSFLFEREPTVGATGMGEAERARRKGGIGRDRDLNSNHCSPIWLCRMCFLPQGNTQKLGCQLPLWWPSKCSGWFCRAAFPVGWKPRGCTKIPVKTGPPKGALNYNKFEPKILYMKLLGQMDGEVAFG
jgi:hypothetical protein